MSQELKITSGDSIDPQDRHCQELLFQICGYSAKAPLHVILILINSMKRFKWVRFGLLDIHTCHDVGYTGENKIKYMGSMQFPFHGLVIIFCRNSVYRWRLRRCWFFCAGASTIIWSL